MLLITSIVVAKHMRLYIDFANIKRKFSGPPTRLVEAMPDGIAPL